MGLRQRKWAVESLGGECAECGTVKKLTLDCIFPTGSWHHRIEFSWRVSYYREQFREGNLQVLCHKHNSIKGQRVPLIQQCDPF